MMWLEIAFLVIVVLAFLVGAKSIVRARSCAVSVSLQEGFTWQDEEEPEDDDEPGAEEDEDEDEDEEKEKEPEEDKEEGTGAGAEAEEADDDVAEEEQPLEEGLRRRDARARAVLNKVKTGAKARTKQIKKLVKGRGGGGGKNKKK